MLLELLPNLFERLHALVRRLLHHLPLSTTARAKIDLTLRAGLIGDILDDLMSAVAEPSRDLGVLTTTRWLRVVRCAIWRGLLTDS